MYVYIKVFKSHGPILTD